MQIKQKVHLPMNLCVHARRNFGKNCHTDSLSPKTHESSVPRFPANKFAQAHADY